MRRFVWILCLLGSALGFAAGAQAADLNAAESRRVRAVIQSQLAAFAADDAVRAFSFATPQLREQFGDADNFLRMVRNSYPVVYRPASVAFLKPALDGGAVTQAVHFTDGNGVLWLALYQLERQRDGSWRIAGCQVVRAEGRVA